MTREEAVAADPLVEAMARAYVEAGIDREEIGQLAVYAAEARMARVLAAMREGAAFEAMVERALVAENLAVCGDPDCCPPVFDEWDRNIMGITLRAALGSDTGDTGPC